MQGSTTRSLAGLHSTRVVDPDVFSCVGFLLRTVLDR